MHSVDAAGLVGKQHRCRRDHSSPGHFATPGFGGMDGVDHAAEGERCGKLGAEDHDIQMKSVDEELSLSPSLLTTSGLSYLC